MPRTRRPPAYRFHKARNCAVVTIEGKNFYLGAHESPESFEKYARLIAEWRATHATPASSTVAAAGVVSINELLLAFFRHASQRYVKNGKPTSEIRSFRTAMRPVRELYGREPVTSFGPLALVACRQKLIDAGFCRTRINGHVGRIRSVFKWGVAREMVPETVWRALCAVQGLRHGEAKEMRPIKPVPEADITAIEPFVTPQIWAMIQIQLLTACRPGEVCELRGIDVTKCDSVWEFRPASHKTQHHGKERIVFIGPAAQRVIRRWLKTDLTAFLFSPREARAWYQQQRALNRKTPSTQEPHSTSSQSPPPMR